MASRRTSFFQISSVFGKLDDLQQACDEALNGDGDHVPMVPGRDVVVLPIKELPAKGGLSSPAGRARLLHDLASIELQATELALRTLVEFPNAPDAFRKELSELVLEEGSHLKDCLIGIERLGHKWGDWPVHLGLWQCVSIEDSLIDRLLIVHRYLEGSGLDAGDTLLRRLKGVADAATEKVVARITQEEIRHVQFGSRWYRKLCDEAGIDPNIDFSLRLQKLFRRVPRRLEPILEPIRLAAGFSLDEIYVLREMQKQWSSAERIHSLEKSVRH